MGGYDLSSADYRSSTYSDNGGQCIQPAMNLHADQGVVPVRDSKNPSGPALVFGTEAWAAFASAVADGEFGAV